MNFKIFATPITLVSVFLFIVSGQIQAQISRYVAITGNDHGGANACADPGTPCRTLAHAVSAAFADDTIRISQGIYTEIVTLNKSLTVQGTGQGATIIQASSVHPGNPGPATNRVITIEENLTVTISDLTLRHGNPVGSYPANAGGGLFNDNSTLSLTNVTFIDNRAEYGGGLATTRSSPTLTNVTFIGNSSGFGGGLYATTGSATLTAVTFTDNLARLSGGGMYSHSGSPVLIDVRFLNNVMSGPSFDNDGGGGMYTAFGSPSLTDVDFTGNTAVRGGGMLNVSAFPALTDVTFLNNDASGSSVGTDGGGGMLNLGSSPSLRNVTFIGNTAVRGGGMRNNQGSPHLTDVLFSKNEAEFGGGMYNFDNSTSVLVNTVFSENTVENNGGGILNSASSPILTNVFLSGNTAGEYGGGVYNFDDSAPVLNNVTFNSNSAGTEGGGIRNFNSSSVLLNSIIWNNNAATGGNEISNNAGGTIELRYSLYRNEDGDIIAGGGFSADENSLTDNPLFVDDTNGDLRLQPGSPAINAGDPDTDLSIFHANEDGIPLDLDGNPRINNGRIDMGAYEYHDPATYVGALAELPASIELYQNYPNPFNPSTTITYDLPERTHVELVVFDLLGRIVAVLVDAQQTPGRYDIHFEAGNLPSGIYLYRLKTVSTVLISKMTFIK
jgi:predicted outer membrane repeat protein